MVHQQTTSQSHQASQEMQEQFILTPPTIPRKTPGRMGYSKGSYLSSHRLPDQNSRASENHVPQITNISQTKFSWRINPSRLTRVEHNGAIPNSDHLPSPPRLHTRYPL
eukprot:1096296-Ditylum_brightwellii.AAC.1